jgi:hypothetical protein
MIGDQSIQSVPHSTIFRSFQKAAPFETIKSATDFFVKNAANAPTKRTKLPPSFDQAISTR